LKLLIGIDGKSYEVDVELLEDDAAPRQTNYVPQRTPSAAQSPAASTPVAAQAAAETAGEDKLIRSPVTGVVIKVNVAPGQTVKANDLVVVLEAMKMETNVTASGAGKVKNVRVTAGDAVKVGQVIVEFELAYW
jgi:methylmalonyl-CoA carboxyltransferase small subunit